MKKFILYLFFIFTFLTQNIAYGSFEPIQTKNEQSVSLNIEKTVETVKKDNNDLTSNKSITTKKEQKKFSFLSIFSEIDRAIGHTLYNWLKESKIWQMIESFFTHIFKIILDLYVLIALMLYG